MGWQSLTQQIMTRNTHSAKAGSGGSKKVKEFSQVEDFGRDIKVETDASSSTSMPSTGAVGAVFTGAPAAATAGPPLSTPPPPAPASPAAAYRPKQPPTSDLPSIDRPPQYLSQPQSQPQPPYSPRQPYEPYYNSFVDDSSNRHIVVHNDDPERPIAVPTARSPPHQQRHLPPFSQRWQTIKRVLTLLSMTWSIVILVLSCLFAVHGGLADGVGLWSLPITIAALLFNSAEFITYCVRRSTSPGLVVRRGMHPGAHVGGHLLLWLTCALAVYLSSSVYGDVLDARRDCNAVAAEFAAADGVTDFEMLLRGHCNSNYHYASNLSLYREGFYVPSLQTLLAMFVLATVTHFALFVRACIEVDQRNQLRYSNDDTADSIFAITEAPLPQEQQQYRSQRSSRRSHNRRDLGTAGSSSYYDAASHNEEGHTMPTRNTTARAARDVPDMAQRPKPYS
ncbi:hypothetical protein PG989_007527 [Apiospora arundinis]